MAVKRKKTKTYLPRYFFAKHKDYVMALYENPSDRIMVNVYDLQGTFVSSGTEPKDKVEGVIKNLIQIEDQEFAAVMRRRRFTTVK